MNDLKSTEALCRENLSSNEQLQIIKLSYESYFQQTLQDMQSVESIDYKINNVSTKFAETVKLLKDSYAHSKEDAEESETLKQKFSATVKDWFIKVWEFMVNIFSQLAAIVVNLIKSLILFIQKKRMSKNALYNNINGVMNTLYMEENAKKMMDGLVAGKAKNKTYNLDSNKTRNHEIANILDVHAALNSGVLKNFITNNAIIIKNTNSIFNTNSLNKFLDEDFNKSINDIVSENANNLVGNPEKIDTDYMNEQYYNVLNDKFTKLENAIVLLSGNAILCGEVSPDHNKSSDYINKVCRDYIDAGDVKSVSHLLTYGTSTVDFETVNTMEFLGITSSIGYKTAIGRILNIYNLDSQLVLGKGGYIDIIEGILKKYKDVAANDAKEVKLMSAKIRDLINKSNSNAKIEHCMKRFTNLVSRVKTVKTKFIALRQYLIGDILTLFSMEDKAVSNLVKLLSDEVINAEDEEAEDVELKNKLNSHNVNKTNPNNLPKDFYRESDESLHDVKEKASASWDNAKEKITDKVKEIKEKTSTSLNKTKEKIAEGAAKLDKKIDDWCDEDKDYSYSPKLEDFDF